MNTAQEDLVRCIVTGLRHGAPVVYLRELAKHLEPCSIFEAHRLGIMNAETGACILQLINEAATPWWVRMWRAFWWG